MRVDPNSSSAFLISGLKDITSSTYLSQSETEQSQNKRNYTVPELADKLNKRLVEAGTHIQVKLHEKTNTIMILVVADDTEEIVREIPKEKMLDMMYNMCVQVGVFLDEKM
ncbi:flagellar protein FlaG [Paenibacillus woosongensis]|uniref:flagellar protein FlaG n=1 Tax=Paenibacillus woosongensis TaxID=307580 RepID=UPI0012D9F8E0|nr:flagellar protein FlaG [Paenibacillus woosongensis]